MVDEKYLDQATVQLNVRIPVRLSLELDKYFAYLDRPRTARLKASKDWPKSRQAVVAEALEVFLEDHPLRDRPGPAPDPPPPQIKARPKTQIGKISNT